jgi:hypothetical protein
MKFKQKLPKVKEFKRKDIDSDLRVSALEQKNQLLAGL